MANTIDWSKIYQDGVDFRVVTPYDLGNMLRRIPKTNAAANALDIGCGTGQLTRDLWFRGFRVKGIDPSSKAIEIAKDAAKAVSDERLVYAVADIFALPNTEKYDLVFCKLVYAFIDDKDGFLLAVRLHLQPHGVCVIITPVFGPQTSKVMPDICVDHDKTLAQLNKVFSDVSMQTFGDVECFFAHS